MPSLEICFSGQKLAVFGDRNFGGARHFLECGRHPSRVLGWFLLDLRCWARGAGQHFGQKVAGVSDGSKEANSLEAACCKKYSVVFFDE